MVGRRLPASYPKKTTSGDLATNDATGVVETAAIKASSLNHSDQVSTFVRSIGESTFRENVRRVEEAICSTNGLSIAADILERAFHLEETHLGRCERPL